MIPKEKQENEIMEYVISNTVPLSNYDKIFVEHIIRTIMRRYDLFDVEDMPKNYK